MQNRAWVIALGLLLLPSAAADVPASRLMASRAEVPSLKAHLVGLELGNGAAGEGGASSGFYLEADELRVVSFEAEPYVWTQTTWVAAPPSNTTTTHRGASLTGTAARLNQWIDVLAISGQMPEVTAGCSRLEPTTRSSIEAPPYVDPKAPSFLQTLSDASQWSSCGTEDFVVQGTFVMTLWEQDALLSVNGQTTLLRSGIEPAGLPEPGASALAPNVGRGRQYYLYASNATLTFSDLNSRGPLVYLRDASFNGNTMTLRDAHGEMQTKTGITPVDGARLELRGSLDAAISVRQVGGSAVLDLQVRGIESAQIDGRTVAIGPASERGADAWNWLWLALLLTALALTYPGLVASRRLRARQALRHLLKLPPSHPDVLAHADVAVERNPDDPLAYFARAQALNRDGQHDAALLDCHEAWKRLPPGRQRNVVATQAILLSNVLQLNDETALWAKRLGP